MKLKKDWPVQYKANSTSSNLTSNTLNNLLNKNDSLIFEPEVKSVKISKNNNSQSLNNVLIVGSGNTAYALACYLVESSNNVSMLMRNQAKLDTLANLTITATGLLNDQYKLTSVTANPKIALSNIDTIFVATNTLAYTQVAENLAPYLNKTQNIILFSSKFGGVLEFNHVLSKYKASYNALIETDALFPCRLTSDSSVNIKGIKDWTLYSAIQPSLTLKHQDILLNYFPNLQLAQNIVQRGLTDFGAFAHPLIMLFNMNKIDSGESFAFYKSGLTAKTIILLEALESEFMALAKAYSTSIIPYAMLLNKYYGCDDSSLYSAIQTVSQYDGILSPASLNHRFIEEDVASSLVPMYHLAKLIKLDIPVIESIINLASILYGIDFKTTGRSLEKLGLSNLNYNEILNYLNE